VRRRRVLRRLLYFVSGLMLGSWAALTPGESFSAKTTSVAAAAGGPLGRAAVGLRAPDPAGALRRAMATKDPMLAAARFAEVARDFKIISDHATLLRARQLMDAHLQAESAAACAAALELYNDSPLRTDFFELLGDARAALSDEDGAREAWTRGIRATRDSDRQAVLRLSVAESLERSDLIDDALTIYRKIWTRHASTDQAKVAEVRLDILEKTPKATQRDGNDWRKRADQLFRKRENEEALRAYDKALASKLKKTDSNRAQKQRAHTLFRMREYPDSVKAFSALPQKDDVPLWRARSLARSGEVPKAVDEFEQLAKKSKGELSVRATYLAGLLLDGRGYSERAEKHFAWVSRNRVSTGLSNAALWRLGWSAFRGQREREAIDYFERLLEEETDTIGRLRTRYWRARALERADEQAVALVEFKALANDFPFSYYGWRARDRVRDHDEPSPGLRPDPGTARLDADDLARPKILLAAGLRKLAIEEMRRTGRKARGLEDRLAMAQLFSEADEYHEALRVVVDAYTEDLARGPVPHLEELWWHAWPSAFEELVVASTSARNSVEPALVYAIMREESGYRPKILSVSGARGLLQIMIPTGELLADRLGEKQYEPDDLFEPATNIKLGAFYLKELMGRFDGRLSASIASYNAGPNAVEGWLENPTAVEDDVWVESIPYDQTRSYVKRVMRSYHAYRVLY
jgi:soluble lytic murein transglycosylase